MGTIWGNDTLMKWLYPFFRIPIQKEQNRPTFWKVSQAFKDGYTYYEKQGAILTGKTQDLA